MEEIKKTKICAKCKEDKELKEFYKCSNSLSGRESYCKECKKEVNKKINLKKKEGIIEFF